MELLKNCLKSSYFTFKGRIYEQTHGLDMRSPSSLVISNIYIEHFEQRALMSFAYTIEKWKKYVDDMFTKWSHGK